MLEVDEIKITVVDIQKCLLFLIQEVMIFPVSYKISPLTLGVVATALTVFLR